MNAAEHYRRGEELLAAAESDPEDSTAQVTALLAVFGEAHVCHTQLFTLLTQRMAAQPQAYEGRQDVVP